MSQPHLWLRAESKPFERRTPLIPDCAAELIAAGFSITVERCEQRIHDDSEYQKAGCEIAETGTWRNAPEGTIILGLKELPEDSFPLVHDHIYFAHAYKEQQGWQDLLSRFTRGGGRLYDLEYLLDEHQRRVAAFGYWAGFAGAAMGILAWARKNNGAQPPLGKLSAYRNKDHMITEIKAALAEAGTPPRMLVIGAKGRSGTGAVDAAKAVGVETVEWDLAETKAGGPFEEVNSMDILINCVFVNNALPPFVTRELLQKEDRALSMVVDVSCDVNSSFNPLPIYTECTDFHDPCSEIISGDKPLHMIAIDHLPTLLPVESSDEYSRQLAKHLLTLGDRSNPVWADALQLFHEKSAGLAALNHEQP